MSFARKVARKNLAKRKDGSTGHAVVQTRVRGPEPIVSQHSSRRHVKRKGPEDVRTDIVDADGNIQCHKCKRSDTLVRLRCEDFEAATAEVRAVHDQVAASIQGEHEHRAVHRVQ